MASFRKVAVPAALIVSFCSSLGWAKFPDDSADGLFQQYSCARMLRPKQTEAMKELSQKSAADIFLTLYTRDIMNPKYEHNIPITEFVQEDLAYLHRDLNIARRYFNIHGDHVMADLAGGLMARAVRMKDDIRHLEYLAFTRVSQEVLAWNRSAIDRVNTFLTTENFAPESAYGFPFFTIPVVSEISRKDEVKYFSANLALMPMSRAPVALNPVMAEPGRFDNFLDFITFVRKLESAAKYIMRQIEILKPINPPEAEKLEALAMLAFTGKFRGHLDIFDKTSPYRSEPDILAAMAASDSRRLNDLSEYRRILRQMELLYEQGGGPRYAESTTRWRRSPNR